MLINRSHKNWILFTALTTILLILSYLLYLYTNPQGPSGGSLPGLIYGNLALLLMVFASLLGARKKVPAWRIGRAVTWMKAHLWLSLLLIPLVLFHSGFKVGGPLTLWIWILFGAVVASGLLGAVLQHFLPSLMTEQVTMETVYDQIDHVISQLVYEADVVVTQVAGSLGIELKNPEGVPPVKVKEGTPQPGSDLLKAFYLDRVRPSLDPSPRLESSFESAGKIKTFFSQANLSLPPPFHPTLETLSQFMEERRQLARQKTIHRWLHGWLFAHVPASAVLMLLVLVHVFTSLWY